MAPRARKKSPLLQRSSSRYLRASSRAGQIWTSYGAQRR
nr:MAG TPA: hypothetical protein [Caudoviricetes sp.]